MDFSNTTLYPFFSLLKLLLVGDPVGVENLNGSNLPTYNLSLFIYATSADDLNYSHENASSDNDHELTNATISDGNEADAQEEITIRRTLLAQITTALAYIILAICGVIGNALVIFAIYKDPILKIKNQLSNMTILNLALTDFTTTAIVCIPGAIAVIYDDYPFHSYFCRFCTAISITTIVATILTLTVISIDRFIAVKWSLHYPLWVTGDRMIYTLGVVWILSISCGCGWVVDETWVAFDYESGICDIRWASIHHIPIAFYWGLFCTIFYFAIPTGILFCLNATIIFLSKEKGRVGNLPTVRRKKNKGDDSQFNAKILKSMIIVILTYLILNVPVAMIRISKVLGLLPYYPPWLTLFSNFCQFLASVLNPLIYGLFRKDFKDSYVKVVKYLTRLLNGYLNRHRIQDSTDQFVPKILSVSP